VGCACFRCDEPYVDGAMGPKNQAVRDVIAVNGSAMLPRGEATIDGERFNGKSRGLLAGKRSASGPQDPVSSDMSRPPDTPIAR